MPLPRSPKWVSGLRPTSESGSNPKDELGMLKLPLGLISQTASVLQALCMQDGSEKYGPYNYRISKVQALIYLEACLRHLSAIIDGEDFDLNTGKPHIGYVLATAQIFADAWVNGYLIDNRPVPGSAGALINLFSRGSDEPELTPADYRSRLEEHINGRIKATRGEDLREAASPDAGRECKSGKPHQGGMAMPMRVREP